MRAHLRVVSHTSFVPPQPTSWTLAPLLRQYLQNPSYLERILGQFSDFGTRFDLLWLMSNLARISPLAPPHTPKQIPMSRYFLRRILLLLIVVSTTAFTTQSVSAYQSADSILSKIESQLRTYTEAETAVLREKAQESCSTAINELSQTAVGYILAVDLRLADLNALLQNNKPDPNELHAFEERLRFITPGRNQKYIDQVQIHVGVLHRALRTNEETLALARRSIEQLRLLSRDQQLVAPDAQQVRSAFKLLSQMAIDPTMLGDLQTTVSRPNVQTQFRTRTLEMLGRTTFHFPVNSSTCTDRTTIQISGSVSVALTPKFAESPHSIPLLMHVDGQGTFNATAYRSPARVNVDLNATAHGLQPLELLPQSIDRESATVKAKLNSQLQDVQLQGHLNRSRLIRNILGKVIERKLAEQDPVLSKTIEGEISKRAEEEGYKLAFKVNRLLTQSLWSRLESVRFTPDISLSSNGQYLSSHSLYAFPDQLGALTSPPTIPSPIDKQLDWTTHIHESAVNNVLSKIRGFQFDEATMRGIWQVQLKLTTPEWATPQYATIPSTITFAAEDPIRIVLHGHRLDVMLNMQTASLASDKTALPPLATNLTYSLSPQGDQFQIVRSPLVMPSQLSEQESQAWQAVLTRFFPETIEPMPKFRPAMWENFVALRYLNIQDGWLSVGLSNVIQAPHTNKKHDIAKGAKP